MAHNDVTTLASVILESCESVCIAELADRLLASPIARKSSERSVGWDCDDLVFVDLDGLRIGLQDLPAAQGAPAIICVAVGATPGRAAPRRARSAKLHKIIIRHLIQDMRANAVLWHEQANQPLDSDMLDTFQDELGAMLDHLEHQIAEASEIAALPACAPQGRAALAHAPSLDNLRQHLRRNQPVHRKLSGPLHASLYLLASTLFFVVPAIGTTLFSYIALRDGVDKSDASA